MNLRSSRVRRRTVRRQQERRKNNFEFNSPEWIAMMKENYVLWPKYDRRKRERRSSDRRKADRRSIERNTSAASWLRQPKISADSILDDDEKQMILDLFREE